MVRDFRYLTKDYEACRGATVCGLSQTVCIWFNNRNAMLVATEKTAFKLDHLGGQSPFVGLKDLRTVFKVGLRFPCI